MLESEKMIILTLINIIAQELIQKSLASQGVVLLKIMCEYIFSAELAPVEEVGSKTECKSISHITQKNVNIVGGKRPLLVGKEIKV